MLLWVVFNVLVVGVLVLDLGVLNKKTHVITYKEALFWTIIWTLLAVVFNMGIFFFMGSHKGVEFLTGYLIERALSFDNLFVFILIFTFFRVPALYQPRVLKWGIIGALAMRLILILVGAKLLALFHWMIFIFGALLLITGFKMAFFKENKVEPDKNLMVRVFRKLMPVTREFQGERFVARINGVMHATPLLIVLLLIESADLVFAVDSIPAIFAVTQDTFIIYTANVFAIFGMRAMYFLLADLMNIFIYLKQGLSVILCFVGIKMLITDIYKIPVTVSLGMVIAILTVSILASFFLRKKKEMPVEEPS